MDDDKDAALETLTASLDEFMDRVQVAFRAVRINAVVLKIDYIAQTAVMELVDPVVPEEKLNQVGIEIRKQWPEMPDVAAALTTSENISVLHFAIQNERAGT